MPDHLVDILLLVGDEVARWYLENQGHQSSHSR